MPMGDGQLFLPVKAAIRKVIKKEAGEWVQVILYKETKPLSIPGELRMCLEDEPKALNIFNTLSESEQKYYIQWIYSAKKEATKVDRIAKTINRLANSLKLYDKTEE